MNSKLMNFDFENNTVRFVEHKEKKFGFGIVAKDLALVLEYVRSDGKPTTDRLITLVDEEYRGTQETSTPSGTQSMSVIWEPGLYQALSRTNKPKAKPFQKKLYEEILPEIRKTGGYNLQGKFNLPQTYLEALKALVQAEENNIILEGKAKEAEDKAEKATNELSQANDTLETYRAILCTESCLSVSQVAKGLGIANLGRNTLYNYLRRRDFIQQKPSLEPYQKRIDEKLAVVETITVDIGNNRKIAKQQAKLTFKGLEWLVKRLKKDKYEVKTTPKEIWDFFNNNNNK